VAASAARRLARPLAATLTRHWAPGTRLFLVGEGAGWSIDHDLSELAAIAGRLGVRVADRRLLGASRDQAAFFGSQFSLLREPWRGSPHRLATAYFHGRPGTPGYPEFDECFRVLCERHRELARVQVSHAEMHELVLSSGIDPAKVFRIPIGVDLRYFAPQTPGRRAAARASLGLPGNALVVGSFHKDGVGWGAGTEPKHVKGPDVLVETLRRVHASVPGLHVLLSGPARGWVRSELERSGVPYVHRLLERYEAIGSLYDALDAYLVPSRQEGGPKGVLEAMASGVPLVTTRVGQATDIVRDGENGRIVDVDDVEGLAAALLEVARGTPEPGRMVAAGFDTARAHSYDAQLPLWRTFFDGFVRAA